MSCADRPHTDCTMLLTLQGPSSLLLCLLSPPLDLNPEPIEANHSKHTQHDRSLAALPRTHSGRCQSGSDGSYQSKNAVWVSCQGLVRDQKFVKLTHGMLMHTAGGRHPGSSQCATDRHCSLWPQLAAADRRCLASIQSEFKLNELNCRRRLCWHLARDKSVRACVLSAAAIRMTRR